MVATWHALATSLQRGGVATREEHRWGGGGFLVPRGPPKGILGSHGFCEVHWCYTVVFGEPRFKNQWTGGQPHRHAVAQKNPECTWLGGRSQPGKATLINGK